MESSSSKGTSDEILRVGRLAALMWVDRLSEESRDASDAREIRAHHSGVPRELDFDDPTGFDPIESRGDPTPDRRCGRRDSASVAMPLQRAVMPCDVLVKRLLGRLSAWPAAPARR
jgi:hypothetical protein